MYVRSGREQGPLSMIAHT